MTRTVSFIAVLAVACLALVPGAWAQQADFWNYDPQTGVKVADTSPDLAARDLAALYAADGSQQAGPASASNPWLAQEHRFSSAEANRADVAPTPATSSGDELEWSQIGIGLSAGIVLTFGLVLGLRMVRRPLAD